MKLTQWVMGCSVFAYLPWDTKCLTLLEALGLVMTIHSVGGWLNLPLLFGCALNPLTAGHVSDVLELLGMGFESVELSGI